MKSWLVVHARVSNFDDIIFWDIVEVSCAHKQTHGIHEGKAVTEFIQLEWTFDPE